MAPVWSIIFPMVILSSYPSLASKMHFQFSAISAAPGPLPDTAPSSSSLPPSTNPLSPDVEPEFPTPGGAMAPSPSSSSIPTIPASPSPPNPDSTMPASGPELASSPSMALPPVSFSYSSVPLSPSKPLRFAAWCIGMLAFRSLIFSAV